MEQYFCDCLNVIINVREKREVAGKSMVPSGFVFDSFGKEEDNDNEDRFFINNLLDVQLGISGIEVV